MPDPSWLIADLAAEVVAPKQSQVDLRSPADLSSVVRQFRVATAERYRKRDVDDVPGDETFCNVFLRDVLIALNAPIPRMKANEYEKYLGGKDGLGLGWVKVPEWVVRYLVSLGCPVVALWTNPDGPHGHVAIVVPPEAGQSGLGITFIAQSGAKNFSYGKLTDGFGNRPVQFFAHQ